MVAALQLTTFDIAKRIKADGDKHRLKGLSWDELRVLGVREYRKHSPSHSYDETELDILADTLAYLRDCG